MDKKVTSYRLSIEALDKLDQLVQQQNDFDRVHAAKHGLRYSKFTKAEYLEYLIYEKWVQIFDSNFEK